MAFFFYGEKGYFVLNKPFPLQEIIKTVYNFFSCPLLIPECAKKGSLNNVYFSFF